MKKYTYKEFLKGEFSILVCEDNIKRTLEKLSQTGLKWNTGVNSNEFIPKQNLLDRYLCLTRERFIGLGEYFVRLRSTYYD